MSVRDQAWADCWVCKGYTPHDSNLKHINAANYKVDKEHHMMATIGKPTMDGS